MSSRDTTLDRDLLKRLVPPTPLTWSEFYALTEGHAPVVVSPGQNLFSDDSASQLVYLLKGEITLSAPGGEAQVVKAGSDAAKRPIRNQSDDARSVLAKTAVSILRIDQSQIDSMSVEGDSTSILVKDLDESLDDTADWMTKIVQSAAFRQLPPAKIHALILRLQELPVRAGQTVMRQGELGDDYYIILRGECEVVRETPKGAKVTLARLTKGQTFGEESLLSKTPRNATVVMATDGLLMSLPKRDFDELIRESLLQEIDSGAAVALVNDGAALLDVRNFDAHKGGSIPGSTNIPLFMLRIKIRELEPTRNYICFCDNEHESVVAAFLLSAWGLQAYVLRGGLSAYDTTDPLFSAAQNG